MHDEYGYIEKVDKTFINIFRCNFPAPLSADVKLNNGDSKWTIK